MGMFDYVDHEPLPCKECGKMLDNWQSKCGPCELLRLPISEVDYFYDMCSECDAWNEYEVEKEVVVTNITIKLVEDEEWRTGKQELTPHPVGCVCQQCESKQWEKE